MEKRARSHVIRVLLIGFLAPMPVHMASHTEDCPNCSEWEWMPSFRHMRDIPSSGSILCLLTVKIYLVILGVYAESNLEVLTVGIVPVPKSLWTADVGNYLLWGVLRLWCYSRYVCEFSARWIIYFDLIDSRLGPAQLYWKKKLCHWIMPQCLCSFLVLPVLLAGLMLLPADISQWCYHIAVLYKLEVTEAALF